MILQEITFFKNYNIKTYTEKVDGLIIVFKRYNKHGDILYLWYSDKEWERWNFNNFRCVIKYANQDGIILERIFDKTGRMSYEKRNGVVTY